MCLVPCTDDMYHCMHLIPPFFEIHYCIETHYVYLAVLRLQYLCALPSCLLQPFAIAHYCGFQFIRTPPPLLTPLLHSFIAIARYCGLFYAPIAYYIHINSPLVTRITSLQFSVQYASFG